VITLSLLHPSQSHPIQSWSFENSEPIRIGRATDNQVVLFSAVVSRHHAELRPSPNGWDVVNRSGNGTYIEDRAIDRTSLADGAIVRLATSGPRILIEFGDGKIGSEASVSLPDASEAFHQQTTDVPFITQANLKS
jgi:pSer/pThr/pTyr-binding forkhead associated (FHA) protein